MNLSIIKDNNIYLGEKIDIYSIVSYNKYINLRRKYMEQRYSIHPNSVKRFDTEELRKNFLVESLFQKNEVIMVYSHEDRFIICGITPCEKPLELKLSKEIGADYFLERREIGIINIGGEGGIICDGKDYSMNSKDGIYIGKGTKEVSFYSKDPKNPSKFYGVSGNAHQTYPIVKINISTANPDRLGDNANSNKRTIYKFIDPSVCQSCQLLMGMTILEPNNMWNTMPAHTHDRRSEVYLYFDMQPTTRVFHMMGQPSETRHLLIANEQVAISPPWSIHAGVGTSNYTFIWAMLGDNQNYGDMDMIAMEDLK